MQVQAGQHLAAVAAEGCPAHSASANATGSSTTRSAPVCSAQRNDASSRTPPANCTFARPRTACNDLHDQVAILAGACGRIQIGDVQPRGPWSIQARASATGSPNSRSATTDCRSRIAVSPSDTSTAASNVITGSMALTVARCATRRRASC